MRKLLIATTNEGKAEEMKHFLETLPFEVISLSNLDSVPDEPAETEDTIEGNAVLKARYYAKHTDLLTLADDGGMFVDALDGWPGVKSARVAPTDDAKCDLIIEKMDGKTDRRASFRTSLALFDPINGNLFQAPGDIRGSIVEGPYKDGVVNYGYNRVFFVDEAKKTYAEMSVAEKNNISHRARALTKIKYHLQNTYSGRHILVPLAFIIKDGKIYRQQRNDPQRLEHHMTWEYPGGAVEYGESVEECIIRETKEETGLDVEIVSSLSYIQTKSRESQIYRYQLYLIPYVCKIIGGEISYNDHEVIDHAWSDVDALPEELKLFDGDLEMYAHLLPELKRVIQEHNL